MYARLSAWCTPIILLVLLLLLSCSNSDVTQIVIETETDYLLGVEVTRIEWELRSNADMPFEPLPFVNRVIFLAVPHRGAPMADSVAGDIGDWMISLPQSEIDFAARLVRDNPGMFTAYEEAHTSIDDLSESSELLQILADLPIRAGLPYHSIMGDVTGKGPPDCEDGVVPYRSSHLDGARSELVIEAGHSLQVTSRAQLEIRRILAEHLR